MAILHFAYSFDADAVAGPLQSTLMRGGPHELAAELKQRAGKAVKHASPVLEEALIAVRYSSDWLDDESDESGLPAKRLVMCMLAGAARVPSLGRDGEP